MLFSSLKKIQVLFLFIFFFTLCSSFGQWKLVDSVKISPENYDSNFKEINEIVRKNYSHLESKNIDLNALFLEVQKKILDSKTKKEYFNSLQYYFSELKNSHTRPFLMSYGINCSAKLVQNRLFLDRVFDDLFIENGIQYGDEILQIDNIQASEWLEKQRQYVSSSTKEGELNSVVLFDVFSATFKDSRVYSIKTQNGIKQLNVNFTKPADYSHLLFRNEPKASGKVLNTETAYIEVKSMSGSAVQDFIKAYSQLYNYQNLIIDLRRNAGGNSDFGEQMARYLLSTKQTASVSRKKIKPKSNSFKGTIYVLTDVLTGSAAESFVLDLRESGKAILVGSPTNGDTGNIPRVFTTEFGFTFGIPTRKPAQVSLKGFPMEGVGIPPHHKIKQTIEDYINKVDTVLEYTLNLIKNKKA